MLLPPRSALRVLRCPPGGLIHLGAARRWIALPPARPAVFTLDKLGRPGRWGVWRSGIKEEAAGRGTAAAPNATPAWSATRPHYTAPLHHPTDRIQTWHSPRRGCCPHACRCACCAAPPRGRTPPWGGPAADSFAPTLGTACPSLPPEGANPALGRPGGGLIWPGRVGRV